MTVMTVIRDPRKCRCCPSDPSDGDDKKRSYAVKTMVIPGNDDVAPALPLTIIMAIACSDAVAPAIPAMMMDGDYGDAEQ